MDAMSATASRAATNVWIGLTDGLSPSAPPVPMGMKSKASPIQKQQRNRKPITGPSKSSTPNAASLYLRRIFWDSVKIQLLLASIVGRAVDPLLTMGASAGQNLEEGVFRRVRFYTFLKCWVRGSADQKLPHTK